MALTERYWHLAGLLVLILGGILIYSGILQEKLAIANSQTEQTKPAKGVIVKSNRSIILGKVEGVERNFPNFKITARVIKSQSVKNYANFIKEKERIEIEPEYYGKGFESPSFFEDKRNLVNLQGYFFLPGDYFIAEVTLFGDERWRKFLYLNIQRITEESIIEEVRNLKKLLKERAKYGGKKCEEM